MEKIYKPLDEMKCFNALAHSLQNKKRAALAANVLDSQKAHLAAGLTQKLNKGGFFITANEVKAKELTEDLRFFFGERVKYYPPKDIIFYSADARSSAITKERLKIIESLIAKEDVIIVAPIQSLFDKLVDIKVIEKAILEFETAEEIAKDSLIEKLIYLGYERADMADGEGRFAVRGGIIDVFPINYDNPVRIEFWGDEIDSIRLADRTTQRSIKKINKIRIPPFKEFIYGPEELKTAKEKINSELNKVLKSRKGLKKESEILSQNISSLKNLESYPHYFYEKSFSILDYIDKNSLIFVDEPNRVTNACDQILFEFEESVKNRVLKSAVLPSAANAAFSRAEILSKISEFQTVLFQSVTAQIKDFVIEDIANFLVKSANFPNSFDDFSEELSSLTKSGYRVLLLAGGSARRARLLKDLSERGFSCENFVGSYRPGVISISDGSLNYGFIYPEIKFAVVSRKEFKREKKRAKKSDGLKIENFTDLKVGDYIVHESHGIGIYGGVEKISRENISKDYLKISYKDGGVLYVATSQMDAVSKYVGDASGVKLNSLGGSEWRKAKARVKGQVEILARDLIKIYAERQASRGFSFSKDTVWQREFEDLFLFEETDDQKIAIEEVKSDMESSRIMDRLICGDVGYGKTEIALRAAFKAVQDGKQTAFLVPTTILAQQHYNTFVERMADFPIKIDMLSRFRSAKEQRETVKNIRKGYVDIVIGTHRLLSKDVEFNDLGLIIIDEEQRFGVAQKEKLKAIRAAADVLALSATPIPRTLHMSLTGIRDISSLAEPPEDRKPVQTYVMEYSPDLLRDAVARELGRGGQVFYLHNRVKNIEEAAAKVASLVPEASVAFAHGQMSERELENVMMEFIEGKIDVLVCTTIIENGLDISNANTIIVNDADYMGLSQLYQLRGRVGRGSRVAYAYLMYRKNKVLNEISEKRLQTIKEFTEFGSGFKIAMRDLEIRGAGNLLGAEQHGYIDAVGYDMYCKLLSEEIKSLRGEETEKPFETSIDIEISAYLPDYYINSEEQKLEIYKKIALIKTRDDYNDIQEEIEDRYGDLPQTAQNLLDVALLKSEAHNKDITSITQNNGAIIITFKADANANPENAIKLIKEQKGRLTFKTAFPPAMSYKIGELDIKELSSLINKL